MDRHVQCVKQARVLSFWKPDAASRDSDEDNKTQQEQSY